MHIHTLYICKVTPSVVDTSHTSVLAECHTLNTSNNSGSGSRHLVAGQGTTTSVKSCGTDSESDWDSWSDDEDEVTICVSYKATVSSPLYHPSVTGW